MFKKTSLIAVSIFSLLSVPQAHAETTGTIAKIKGKVTYKAPTTDNFKKAKKNMSLEAGTNIKTGTNGYVTIALANGSQLELKPNSSMKLSGKKRKQTKKNSVILFFGKLWSKVTKSIGSEKSYEISSANAVAGVRGTEFETQVADDGSIRVKVTEGKVNVKGDQQEQDVAAGQLVDGNEEGIQETKDSDQAINDKKWQKESKQRLQKNGGDLGKKLKEKIMKRKATLEDLRTAQKQLLKKRAQLEQQLKSGDRSALDEIKAINEKLADIADQIAELGDQADSQFGLFDHYDDLASDPAFKMIGAKYIKAEAKSLRKIKAQFDAMIAEGTDISMKSMDDLLKDMGSGKHGTMKDQEGSSVKDLFGDDPF